MDLTNMESDAVVNAATNIVLASVLKAQEEVLLEEEVLQAQWEGCELMYKDHYYANSCIQKLLTGHPNCLYIRTRMTYWQFTSLAQWLKIEGGLTASKYVNSNTKLAIFLHICGQGATMRDASEYWEVPISQVTKYFHEVLDALVLLSLQNVQMYKIDKAIPVPKRIAQDTKMQKFINCVGAIDGTLLMCNVKGQDRRQDGKESAYCYCKGWLANNVLGCVDFDINFKLVWPGWEGSAHNATVLNDAIAKGQFKTPKGRVWLANASYTLKDGYGGQIRDGRFRGADGTYLGRP